MKDFDSPTQPTATSALARFEEICMTLRQEDFGRQVEATRWISGKFISPIFGHIMLISGYCREHGVSKRTSCVFSVKLRNLKLLSSDLTPWNPAIKSCSAAASA
jgi:hypothetical protein